MAEKDMTEKTLESYNDVFADIVNVLLFNGRQVVKENELTPETPRSLYKADGKLHEQERDVAKFWKNTNVRIALYGLENQTEIDVDIPLRVISYDGAAYRDQLNGQKKRYPVVTLVLYFGEKRWNNPRCLHDCLEIPEDLKPYVSDYKVNVFEIAWLSEEQVKLFQSDFKYVADYFVQVRKNKEYVPSAETIDHVRETLQLLAVLTKDNRFEEYANTQAKEGEKVTMSEVLDRMINEGYNRGISIGEARGISIGEARGISIGEARKNKFYEDEIAMLKEKLAKYEAQEMSN